MNEFLFLLCGFAIGWAIADSRAKARYQSLLLMCARAYTPEKFNDGEFYYVVPETDYVEMKRCQLFVATYEINQQQKKNPIRTPVPHA